MIRILTAAAFAVALLASAAVRAECPGHNQSVQTTQQQTVVDGTATTPPPATTDTDATKTGG